MADVDHHRHDWPIESYSKLRKLLQKLPKRDHISGFIKANAALEVIQENGESLSCGTLRQPTVDRLLEHATTSTFGKELTATQLHIRFPERPKRFHYFQKYTTFAECLYQAIVQNLPKGFLSHSISFRFNKLTLHEPGEHFDLHRDTVHDENHVATLLIEVNSPHTGGDLVLVKDGIETRWSSSEPCEDRNTLRWIMFYPNVEYRVEEVTSGVQLFLQFHVFDYSSAENSDMEMFSEYDVSGTDLLDSTTFLKENETPDLDPEILLEITLLLREKLNASQVIAIPLYYRYNSQTFRPEGLKSFDAQVFQGLVARGFGVALALAVHTITSDVDGLFNSGWHKQMMNIYDFPLVIHYYDRDTNTVHTTELLSWPATTNLTYYASGMEHVTSLEKLVYDEWRGNQSTGEGCHVYLGQVMILFPQPLSQFYAANNH